MPAISEIAEFLDAGAALEFPGDHGPGSVIEGPGTPGSCGRNRMTFIHMTVRDPEQALRSANAGLAIVALQFQARIREILSGGIVGAVLWSSNPRLDFCRVLEKFFMPPSPQGIAPSATVAPSAKVGARCYIGPGCVISENVELGDDCVLYGQVFLYPGTRLGKRVTVHAGAVIGAEGFGYEKRPDGSWQKFPHLGGVRVGDDVEIGANAAIDRGSLTDTVICDGVKIDNLVHIAHNAYIGANALIIAGAVVCGGARIGERTWVAPQACVREKVSIGADGTIGMGAVVNADTTPGATMVSWHARPALATKRIFTFLQRIADGDTAPHVNPGQQP